MKAIGLVGLATLVAIGAGVAVKADLGGGPSPASNIGNTVDADPRGDGSGAPDGDPDGAGAPADADAGGLPPDGDPDGTLGGPGGVDEEDADKDDEADDDEADDDEPDDEPDEQGHPEDTDG